MIELETIKTRRNRAQRLAFQKHAQHVMDRLMKNRTASREYHQEAGEQDPLIVVTGRSAIDRAIDTTREMMQDLETAVRSDKRPGKFNTMCNGLSRLRSRLV